MVTFKVTLVLDSDSIATEDRIAGAIENAILERFEWINVKSINAQIVTENETA